MSSSLNWPDARSYARGYSPGIPRAKKAAREADDRESRRQKLLGVQAEQRRNELAAGQVAVTPKMTKIVGWSAVLGWDAGMTESIAMNGQLPTSFSLLLILVVLALFSTSDRSFQPRIRMAG